MRAEKRAQGDARKVSRSQQRDARPCCAAGEPSASRGVDGGQGQPLGVRGVRTVEPLRFWWRKLAPLSRSRLRTSMEPWKAAKSSGVLPFLSGHS
eukprot:4117450-Pleurochrysis_carterae.AAC.2